jgi:tRNA(Ile)-lysidine synthase
VVFPHPNLVDALRRAWKGMGSVSERLAVATSGGADSAMMAAHVAALGKQSGKEVILFHVHHGLQDAADGWAEHVFALGRLIGSPVYTAYAQVDLESGLGIEAAARDARYIALAQLARDHQIHHIVLAHHQNDQAETVLLRLLRGTGPDGMAAMAASMQRDDMTYHRPWLNQRRDDILEAAQVFGQQHDWHPVQDPTNADPRYTRAAVREMLAPLLNERWPGWQARVASHARLAAESTHILQGVAKEDFSALQPSPDNLSFSLVKWRELPAERQALLLRYWFSLHNVRMPTEARLADLLRQLRQLHNFGHDRHMKVGHGDHFIRCHRAIVWLEPR